MRKILIVCGAGASSTFLAHRMRASARGRGLEASIRAETLAALVDSLANTDVVLIGPHLRAQFDEIRRQAETAGVVVGLLPEDVFGAHGADIALDTVESLLSSDAVTAAENPRP